MENLVCRTCLGIISERKMAHNIDAESGLIRNVRNIREIITSCVPEMNIYISISPVVCDSCLGILISVYNFKIRCLRVENAIRSYVMTHNVMEGSCVNLNNVVQHQRVEALKQKNRPSELISKYVDKHAPASRSSGELFQAMAPKVNAPQLLINSSLRPPGVLEPPPVANGGGNVAGTLVPPFEAARLGNPRVPAPAGSSYLSISKNLMSPRLETPHLTQQSMAYAQFNPVSPQSSSLVAMASLPLPAPMPTSMHIGAVMKKKKRARKKPIHAKSQLGSLNSTVSTNGDPSVAILPVLGPTAGPAKESGLGGVRKSCTLQSRNNDDGTEASRSDDVIILDEDVIILGDDAELETQRVGDEVLLMNFEEDYDVADSGVQVETQTSDNAETSDFRETLKRKLTPEDMIDEIETKRRKMVVTLSSSLPNVHENKRLLVKVRRDKFYSCMFCRYVSTTAEGLETHYLASHWVCSLCNYKCKSGPNLAQHIYSNHSLELQETLEKLDKHQPETSPQTILQNALPQNDTLQLQKEQDGDISSTTMSQAQRHGVLDNSLDIVNPQVVDEDGPIEQKKIQQPPKVFPSRTREVHNSYERNRYAHLKECFDMLKKQLPTNGEEKNTSNLSLLRLAFRCIQNLKLREHELEHEMERLDREKISHQQRLATLKKDISTHFGNVDFFKILPEISSSTTSITQNGGTEVKRDSMDGRAGVY